jgi:hypothetical protein
LVAVTITYTLKISVFCPKYTTAAIVDVHMAMAMKCRLNIFDIQPSKSVTAFRRNVLSPS